MVKFKELNRQHADFKPEQLVNLRLLYKGGYDLLSQAHRFLTQLNSETEAAYQDRLKACSYLPFMSDIIDHYVSMLFSQELAVQQAKDADDASTIGNALEEDDKDVYKLFTASANLSGNSLEQVMRDVLTDAMIYQSALVGIDFPKVNEIPSNLLEEEVLQAARPYLYYIDPSCVINWKYNAAGNFDWLVIKEDCFIQNSALDEPKHTIEFKIWFMEGETAKWQLYRTKEMPLNKMPAANDDIPLVESGSTSFRELPILELCLPDGLAMGNKIGPICQDVFQRTSLLVNSENRSLNAMRVAFLGNEDDGPGTSPSMVQENPFRAFDITKDWESRGVSVLGGNDRMEVIEAKGHAFAIVAQQIDGLIEKLKEVVHQMANTVTTNKQKARSAQSKQEDRFATEIILTAYGTIIKDLVKHMMATISTAREETIVWTVAGLDNFSVVDRDQLILEAQQFPGITAQSISPTFTKLYIEKFYLSLLNGTSNEESLQIKEEIMKAVDSMPPTQFTKPFDEANGAPQDSSSNPGNPGTDDTGANMPVVDETGNMPGYEGMHLSDNEHIDPQVVYDQLAEDYDEKDIQFVLNIAWVGPFSVPLTSIDFSNKDSWAAAEDQDHVDEFVQKVGEGWSKPIILVDERHHNGKMVILDGHHRALAYLQMGKPIPAYVGEIGKLSNDMKKMHSRQAGSKQMSNQMASNQKAVSNQVSKSEDATNGKTK